MATPLTPREVRRLADRLEDTIGLVSELTTHAATPDLLRWELAQTRRQLAAWRAQLPPLYPEQAA